MVRRPGSRCAHPAFVAGLRGHLFRSDDAGLNWTRTESGTSATLAGLTAIAPDRILVAGLAGTLLVSEDGGRTVTARSLPARQGIAAALAAPDGTAFLIGEAGIQPVPGLE